MQAHCRPTRKVLRSDNACYVKFNVASAQNAISRGQAGTAAGLASVMTAIITRATPCYGIAIGWYV